MYSSNIIGLYQEFASLPYTNPTENLITMKPALLTATNACSLGIR